VGRAVTPCVTSALEHILDATEEVRDQAGPRPGDGAHGSKPTGQPPLDARRRRLGARVSLRTRMLVITFIGGLVTAIIVGSAFESVSRLNQANHALSRIAQAQRFHQDADMMHDALHSDVLDSLLVHEHLIHSPADVRDDLEQHGDQLRRDLAGIQRLHLAGPLRDRLAVVRTSLGTYLDLARHIVNDAFVDRADALEDLRVFESAFDDLAESQAQMTEALADVRAAKVAQVDRAETAAQRRIAGAALAGLAGLLAMFAMLARVVKPINALARAAERLGAGDFSARAELPGVPEIDKVSEAFNTTAERIGNVITRERAFSADASHQLRTPITGMRLRLEHALQSPNEDRETALRDGLHMLDQLEATVEGLLALAREERHSDEVLDISALLSETAERSRPHLTRLGRPLVVEQDSQLPVVRASAVAVREILQVLTANAIVHGEGRVTLRVRDTGAGVSIEVEDQGTGVLGNPERIFARRSPSEKGYGIGLALARSLATAEGGRLFLMRAAPHPVFALMLLSAE